MAATDGGNGDDWRELIRRLEEDHQALTRDVIALRESMVMQKANVDKLLEALRALIDRIPPENLRQP